MIDIYDDEQFASHVRDSLIELDISDIELARRFDMSISSVDRWRRGRNLCHPAMRQSVVDYFKAKRDLTK